MSRLVLCALCALLIGTASACDLVVAPGDSLTLGNRGSVFGSSSMSAAVPALPAVEVQPGGSATVADADVFGGSVFPMPADFASSGAAGIEVSGGSLRVLQGRVQGGSVVFRQPPVLEIPTGQQFGLGGVGVHAVNADVEILGGTLVGGSVVGVDDPAQFLTPGGGLRSVRSRIAIRGGTFALGVTKGGTADQTWLMVADLFGSSLQVSGGDFQGTVRTEFGRNVITGGAFPRLQLGNAALPPRSPAVSGCTEIRGGTFGAIELVFGEQLIIFGTGFNVPPGPLTIDTPRRLEGVLESGTPLSAVISAITLRTQPVILAAPGSAGCP